MVVEKYPALQAAVQKMHLMLDHQALMATLGFVSKLVAVLSEDAPSAPVD